MIKLPSLRENVVYSSWFNVIRAVRLKLDISENFNVPSRLVVGTSAAWLQYGSYNRTGESKATWSVSKALKNQISAGNSLTSNWNWSSLTYQSQGTRPRNRRRALGSVMVYLINVKGRLCVYWCWLCVMVVQRWSGVACSWMIEDDWSVCVQKKILVHLHGDGGFFCLDRSAHTVAS